MPDETPQPRRFPWKGWIFGLALVGTGAALAWAGLQQRAQRDGELSQRAAERAIATVAVSVPKQAPGTTTLDLPGRLDAYYRAAIFARVSGYLASRKVDIGSHVKTGDLLAEIDAPDLDQQLAQAESDLNNARANAALADVTNQRYQKLLPSSYVTQQAADEKASDLIAKNALVKSAQANVDRLKALTEYKRLVAPFDGVVTVRNTDVGNLINTGSATGSELFVVSDVHKLRLYVNVPQVYVPQITKGTRAILTVPEHPGKSYEAQVEASAGAVDVSSGTTRMQLVVDNSAGELMPGAYANVHLTVGNPSTTLSIPASALLFDKEGLRAATIGRDLGSTIEVASGLSPEDRVIESVLDGIQDGDKVNIKDTSKPPPTASEGPVPKTRG
jgi:RND family efflux transporter MFP subunit